jgi:hypothetical protein
MQGKSSCEATIQIDPTFPYYTDRSADSIAGELELAGYRTVRYFVTVENAVNGKLIDALHRRGMRVFATVLGNGTYTTAHLPPGWESWQMTLLKPVKDGFFRFSPFCRHYVDWKRAALHRLVKEHPFDGLEIAEPYFPEWNGLSSRVYGDVGPWAAAAFRAYSGSDMPEFTNRFSPRYYKRDKARYHMWVEFRVKAVNDFLNELINGDGGVRSGRPGITIATWSVAVDAGKDPVSQVREVQGIDAAAMISIVRPELHYIQTHWPDWMRARLPADYARRYHPFVEAIRRVHPAIPLGLQTDSGSLPSMRRSQAWLKRFADTAASLGYQSWTAYEYHIDLGMYEEPPIPMRVRRLGENQLRLEFSKRVTAGHASFSLYDSDGRELPGNVMVQQTDGHQLLLRCDLLPSERFQLQMQGIQDTPERWLVKGAKANGLDAGNKIWVPQV